MKTHIDEAKEELNREFTADRDYTPTPSLFKSLHWSFVVCVLLVACLVTIAIFGIVHHKTSQPKNEFEGLHLPTCDNPDWKMYSGNTGSWFYIDQGKHTLSVTSDAGLWFDHAKVLSDNAHVKELYNCVLRTQINNFNSLK